MQKFDASCNLLGSYIALTLFSLCLFVFAFVTIAAYTGFEFQELQLLQFCNCSYGFPTLSLRNKAAMKFNERGICDLPNHDFQLLCLIFVRFLFIKEKGNDGFQPPT